MSEILKNTAQIITGVVSGASIVMLIVALVLKRTNNKKAQAVADKMLALSAEMNQLNNFILGFMKQAEDNVNFTGADKKKWVVMQVKSACVDAGISCDEHYLEEQIENLIEFSKIVNPPLNKKSESEDYKKEVVANA